MRMMLSLKTYWKTSNSYYETISATLKMLLKGCFYQPMQHNPSLTAHHARPLAQHQRWWDPKLCRSACYQVFLYCLTNSLWSTHLRIIPSPHWWINSTHQQERHSAKMGWTLLKHLQHALWNKRWGHCPPLQVPINYDLDRYLPLLDEVQNAINMLSSRQDVRIWWPSTCCPSHWLLIKEEIRDTSRF